MNDQQASTLQSQGIVAINRGHFAEGAKLLRSAVKLDPDNARCHANLSVALERLGRIEEAIASSLEAIRLQPDFADALGNLGVVLSNAGRPDEALPYLDKAAALDPTNLIVWLTAATYHTKREEWSEAVACYSAAYKLNPTLDDTISGLVAALSTVGRNVKALAVLEDALKLDPSRPLTWNNAGCILRRLGRNQEALAHFDRALALAPDLATAAWGRALCLLALGRIPQGWVEYEWGFKTGDRQPKREFPQPRWDGSSLAGKTILVWMEQGLGDHICFASMLPDLIESGAHLVVECEHRLVSLLQRSFPAAAVVMQTLPPQDPTVAPGIDYQIPAGGLPQFLRPNLSSFPERESYLVADHERRVQWRERIEALGPNLKVGISWRSLKTAGTRAMDCMSLAQWGPILSIPGIQWVNLQCGWTEDELRVEVGDNFDCHLHSWQGLDLKDDQDEMAALISCLDLVVTAFTVTAQLAGALGVPCWVLNHLGNQSWFSLGRDHCPWHPSIRFFPCDALEPWDTAIADLALELRQRFCL